MYKEINNKISEASKMLPGTHAWQRGKNKKHFFVNEHPEELRQGKPTSVSPCDKKQRT